MSDNRSSMSPEQDRPSVDKTSIPKTVVDYIEFDCNLGDELLNVVEHLKSHGSVILKGPHVTLQELSSIRALLKAQDFHSYFELANSAIPSAIYMAVHPVSTNLEMERVGGDDLSAFDQEQRHAFFERVYRETRGDGGLSDVVNILTAALRSSEDYRLGWIANLAQAFVMAGMEHYAAQEGAANFLDIFAKVNARKDTHFQSRPDESVTPKVSIAATTLAVENEGRCVEIYLTEKNYQAYLVIHYVNELMSMLGLPTAQPDTADSKPRVRVHPDGYVPPAENTTRVERANQLLDLIFSMPREAHSAVYASHPKFMQLAFFAHTLGAENVWFKLLDD
jgi:hypothetical protein